MKEIAKLDYIGRAKYILKNFLNDFTEEEVEYCVNGAYTGSFDNEQIDWAKKMFAKKYPKFLSELKDGFTYIFELIHLH